MLAILLTPALSPIEFRFPRLFRCDFGMGVYFRKVIANRGLLGSEGVFFGPVW